MNNCDTDISGDCPTTPSIWRYGEVDAELRGWNYQKPQSPLFAMENDPRQTVPILAAVELSKRSPALMTQRAEARRLSTAEQRGAGVTGRNGSKRRR